MIKDTFMIYSVTDNKTRGHIFGYIIFRRTIFSTHISAETGKKRKKKKSYMAK